MFTEPISIQPSTQQGAILIISLIFLLLMTILGITAMTTNSLEEKMSGNTKNKHVAFQAAEAALRDGEAWLKSLSERPLAVSTCANNPCDVWQLDALDPDDSDFIPWWDMQTATINAYDINWWKTHAREYGSSGIKDLDPVADDPYYIIEEQIFVPDSPEFRTRAIGRGRMFYRITSLGVGGIEAAQTVLQSTYARRFR